MCPLAIEGNSLPFPFYFGCICRKGVQESIRSDTSIFLLTLCGGQRVSGETMSDDLICPPYGGAEERVSEGTKSVMFAGKSFSGW